jgi:hypothetical protein
MTGVKRGDAASLRSRVLAGLCSLVIVHGIVSQGLDHEIAFILLVAPANHLLHSVKHAVEIKRCIVAMFGRFTMIGMVMSPFHFITSERSANARSKAIQFFFEIRYLALKE